MQKTPPTLPCAFGFSPSQMDLAGEGTPWDL